LLRRSHCAAIRRHSTRWCATGPPTISRCRCATT
jgi:hypothetical protein